MQWVTRAIDRQESVRRYVLSHGAALGELSR